MTGAGRDAAARRAALDPVGSFIVQAPAGSGKTELLIQRFLTLLATVHEPEQVVAITFTRKAAAEMRTRILAALRGALTGTPVRAEHERATRALAEAAVRRDAELDWQLLDQPQRLRVDTLDALNAWLAQRLPVLAGGAAGAAVVENAAELYAEAARRTLDELGSASALGAALRQLLPALDNSVPRLEKLLADLLPKRDQWQRHLFVHDDAELRTRLEDALARLVDDELEFLERAWREGRFGALPALLEHAAEHATRAKLAEALKHWRGRERAPADTREALEAWRGIAALLLTDKGEWRSRLTKAEGFAPEHADAKRALGELIEALADDEPLRTALAEVPHLPPPEFDERQWQDLAALGAVLRHLVAELRVLFADTQSVDFVELSAAAQAALGRVDAPSDLLLALDRRIRHLLVDEFQDTSHAQVRLLELLTGGWQPGDGRTLFLVGDPMQSIYRFRDADMGLFLKIKQQGLGSIACRPLVLEANHRSSPAVVDWVNATFARIFPDEDRIEHGIARFHGSVAEREPAPDDAVCWHVFRSARAEAEAERVVDIVGSELERDPEQSIAILVRSRTHLAGLRPRLAQRGWPVQTVAIDAVADSQLGQDLIALTRALTHAADRIAWLAVLRAPWCGLTWADLLALAGRDGERTVLELLHDDTVLAGLSAAGRKRALALRGVVTRAFETRGTLAFARWVQRVWLALGGPAAVAAHEDAGIAERFFSGLAELAADGDVPDPAAIEAHFSRVGTEADPPGGPGVQIMTVHRAKGLEFDTVVLSGLARRPRGDDAKALYWAERLEADGSEGLLMAPLARGPDRLNEYLRRRDQQLEAAERARLLYVATTRAAHRLHLVANLGDAEAPDARSLLACTWPAAAAHVENDTLVDAHVAPEASAGRPPALRRFAEPVAAADTEADGAHRAAGAALEPEFEWAGRTAVQVGNLVHAELKRLADREPHDWDPDLPERERARYRAELELLGVDAAELDAATQRAVEALAGIARDATGRWLLAPHAEAASELSLTLRTAEGLEHVRLDRSFVADGVRWIVDYKTSVHEGADVDAFLASEAERYAPQLERYADAIAAIDARPIRVGLYFPLLAEFRSWTPAVSAG